MSLNQARQGESRVVRGLIGDSSTVRRLHELGFLPGETVTVLRRMIFGGPLVVQVRGAAVALRREEATCVNL